MGQVYASVCTRDKTAESREDAWFRHGKFEGVQLLFELLVACVFGWDLSGLAFQEVRDGFEVVCVWQQYTFVWTKSTNSTASVTNSPSSSLLQKPAYLAWNLGLSTRDLVLEHQIVLSWRTPALASWQSLMLFVIWASDSPATYVCCSLAVLSVPSTKTVAVMPFAEEPGLDPLLLLAALAAGVEASQGE